MPNVSGDAYLNELGRELKAEIGFIWTGPDVVSETISVESIRELAAVIQRKPVIWDNLHANDYDNRRYFVGPYAGRSAGTQRRSSRDTHEPELPVRIELYTDYVTRYVPQSRRRVE